MIKVGDINPFEVFNEMGRDMKKPIHIQLPNASEWLKRGFIHYLGEEFKPQPEYDEVADWLTDNHNKGLLLYGNCGRGKSLLAECILPKLIRYATGKVVRVYSYRDVNKKLAEIIEYPFVCIDDIGQETVGKEYGNMIFAVSDIIDRAEKDGHLLILTTNLNLFESGEDELSLEEKYGDRSISRLKNIVKTVAFEGDDLRGK